ncbi:MAG: hypothetical protein AAGD10_06190 [Myxococcota bacterium]
MRRVLLGAILVLTGCSPTVHTADEVLGALPEHLGEKVVMEVELFSGARCRVGEGPSDFKAYCRDCQYCSGPLVVRTNEEHEGVDDWPMVLGGTHAGRPIRCEGPLNEVACHPFEPGKTYVIRGSIEKTHPPKLLVSAFHEK